MAYYDKFDSWQRAFTEGKSFVVTTVGKTNTYTSSAIPSASLMETLTAIEDAIDHKTSWTQWDRIRQRVTLIPYEEICSITIDIVT